MCNAAFEPGRTLPARTVDFWFDYTCPFAYLASTRVVDVALRMGATLTYRPLLLGGVFRAVGTPQNLSGELSPPKAAHNLADMQRWAKRFGVPLTMPSAHPMRSVEALRATLATGIDPAVVGAFYRAYWVEGRAISDPEVIRDIVGRAGYDPVQVLKDIDTPRIKDELRARTDEAIARGIFGVPTFIVDTEHLYWGQDRLTFVEGTRQDDDVVTPRPTGKTVEVYWDFSSPFAYLASTQLEALAQRTGARIMWRPVLLGGLFRAIGTPDAPILTWPEAKRTYILADLHRWAAYCEVPFRFPSRFPMRTLNALRVWLALPEGRRDAFREAVFRAYWAEDRDIADPLVLAELAGADVATAALARAATEAIKRELKDETERAVARGVFGVPTFVVEGELFWGQDRLDLVRDALAT